MQHHVATFLLTKCSRISTSVKLTFWRGGSLENSERTSLLSVTPEPPRAAELRKGPPLGSLALGWVPSEARRTVNVGSQTTPISECKSSGGCKRPIPSPRADGHAAGGPEQALAPPGPHQAREEQGACPRVRVTWGILLSEVLYLWRVEQELVEVLQPGLNAVQDAAADGAQPLQSLRKGVHQALCPVDEEADGDGTARLRAAPSPAQHPPPLSQEVGGCLRPRENVPTLEPPARRGRPVRAMLPHEALTQPAWLPARSAAPASR